MDVNEQPQTRGQDRDRERQRQVAIIGGSGYMGGAVARSLIAHGASVTIVTRSDRDGGPRPGVTWRRYRTDRPDELAAILTGHDAVINVAGTPIGPRPWTPARKRSIRASRIETTRLVVDALTLIEPERRPAALVNVSGTDRYTNLPGGPATEAAPSATGFLADLCRDWEAEAMRAESAGIRVAIVRVGFVIGPGAHILRLFTLPFRLFLGGPIGSGDQWMSWVHVDDVAEIFALAAVDPRFEGPVNAVAPEPIHERDLASAVAGALRRPSWLRVPAFLVRLVMREQATLILDSRRVAPARLAALGYRHRWTELQTAVADALGR